MASTRSEELFETFLIANNLTYRRLAEDAERRADFEVDIGDTTVVFEVKQIERGEQWVEGTIGRTVGKKIRELIGRAKRQLQGPAQDGKPTVLLVFNAGDPAQLFETEPHDFDMAMHGDWVVDVDVESGKIVGSGRGLGKALQDCKNTSISALGHLLDNGIARAPTVTLFLNPFARNPLDVLALPPCFKTLR